MKAFHGWMAFKDLDENKGLALAFTIGYRFSDDLADDWTNRFNRFEAKTPAPLRRPRQPLVSAWLLEKECGTNRGVRLVGQAA